MSIILELGKFPCIKCGEQWWAWPRSVEEINTLQCISCSNDTTLINDITEDLNPLNPTSETPEEIYNQGGNQPEQPTA